MSESRWRARAMVGALCDALEEAHEVWGGLMGLM